MRGPKDIPSAEIVAVGNELLRGDGTDTNSAVIQGFLLDAGIRPRRTTVVGDAAAAIAEVLREAAGRADAVVVTGGLGPTEDDVTREGAAAAAGVELRERPEAAASITAFFEAMGRPVPRGNMGQARLPAGADLIANPIGTAPGFSMDLGRCRLFFLPGVPREMRAMMEGSVFPALRNLFPDAPSFARRKVHIVGVPESAAGRRIKDLMRGRDLTVGITVHDMVLTVTVTSFSPGAEEIVERAAQTVRSAFGERVFGEGEDSSLPAVVVRLLAERGITLAAAESCTGGLVGFLITSVPGSSAVFREGAVTYSDEAKVRALGVDSVLLERRGAVSLETARAMAEGAAARAECRAAVAVTGIAGPGGGTAEKPVGLVYIAARLDGRTQSRELRLAGGRDAVRRRSAVLVLDLLRGMVLGFEEKGAGRPA